MVSGIYDIYAQADAFDENGSFYWGAIAEDREDNNIRQESLPVSDLTVTKEAVPPAGSLVAPGSFITYTIIYSNLSNTVASQAVLTDTFDPLGNYTIHSYSVNPDHGDNVWHLGNLSAKSGGAIEIVAQLNSPLPNHWPVTNRASLYSGETGPLPSPVITHTVMNYSGADPEPMVDLVITDIRWTPSAPKAGTWPRFEVTVVNTGTADAVQLFLVELYIKPQPSSPPEWPGDHDRGSCLDNCATLRDDYLGYVSGLAAGASKVVSFPNLDGDPSPDFPMEAGTYDIYAQADARDEFSADSNFYWGSIAEDYEDNNVRHESLVVGSNPRLYLPIVSKRLP
jgi:uncharacterized repeat protein (TIGR01451 family)